MTAKETASELFKKYLEFVESFSSEGQKNNAIQCALVDINNTIETLDELDLTTEVDIEEVNIHFNFCQDVKKEIEKLKT